MWPEVFIFIPQYFLTILFLTTRKLHINSAVRAGDAATSSIKCFEAKLIRFGQIWLDLVEICKKIKIWANSIRFWSRAQPGGELRELKPIPPLSQIKVEKKDKKF